MCPRHLHQNPDWQKTQELQLRIASSIILLDASGIYPSYEQKLKGKLENFGNILYFPGVWPGEKPDKDVVLRHSSPAV